MWCISINSWWLKWSVWLRGKWLAPQWSVDLSEKLGTAVTMCSTMAVYMLQWQHLDVHCTASCSCAWLHSVHAAMTVPRCTAVHVAVTALGCTLSMLQWLHLAVHCPCCSDCALLYTCCNNLDCTCLYMLQWLQLYLAVHCTCCNDCGCTVHSTVAVTVPGCT